MFVIPKVVQSDKGSNFTSWLFAQVLKQLHIRHNQCSAYHAQSQGAYCTELGGDWEDGLPWLHLSITEVVQESTGFSPYDLVFGHQVCGPLAVVSEDLNLHKA